MKEGWEYSTIGDLCDKMNGLWKGKIGPFVNVGVIRNANFTKSFTLSFDNIEYLDVEAKQYKTRKLQRGDLIVEKSGGSEKQPVGRTVLFDKEEGEYSFSNFTSVLRIKDRDVISPEFLYKYILFVYLRGDTRKMQKATTGIHNIEFDKFLSISVPKISLSEQQSIVDYLDSAFAKIDAMKANAEKALNEAKALFQASLKEMLEPKEGWEEKTIEHFARIVHGKNQKEVLDSNGSYPIYGSGGNIMGYANAYLCEAGTTILGRKGTIDNPLFIDERFWNVDTAFGIIAKDNCNKKYLYYSIKKVDWAKLNTGTTLPSLTQNVVYNVAMCAPPLSEQQSIVATLDSLKSKVDRLQTNYDKISQECDALKQALLRQVFE